MVEYGPAIVTFYSLKKKITVNRPETESGTVAYYKGHGLVILRYLYTKFKL